MASLKKYTSKILSINPVHRQSFIGFLSKIILTGLGFLSTIYIARVAGPSVYGDFAIFLAYFGIIQLITDGGLGSAAVKKISEGESPNKYFSAYFSISALVVFFAIIILYLSKDFLTELNSSGMLFWLILGLIASLGVNYFIIGIYGLGKVGVYQSSRIIEDTFKIIFQVLAIFLGYGAAGLAGGLIGGTIMRALFCLPFQELHLEKYGLSHLTSLLPFAFWIFLGSVGSTVFSYADTIIISQFMNSSDVGIYRIAFQLTAFATFSTVAIQAVLYPNISKWHTNGLISKIEESTAKALSYGLFIAVPVCVGGIILGDKMLYYFYGASFESGYETLVVLFFVQIVNVFMFQYVTTLNAVNKPRETFKATLMASVINIILNLLLIPVIGILGAAVATLFTMIINAGIAKKALSKEIKTGIEKKGTMDIIFSAIIMGVFVFAVRNLLGISNVIYLVLTIVLAGIIYVMILFRINNEMKNELRDILIQFGMPWPKWL